MATEGEISEVFWQKILNKRLRADYMSDRFGDRLLSVKERLDAGVDQKDHVAMRAIMDNIQAAQIAEDVTSSWLVGRHSYDKSRLQTMEITSTEVVPGIRLSTTENGNTRIDVTIYVTALNIIRRNIGETLPTIPTNERLMRIDSAYRISQHDNTVSYNGHRVQVLNRNVASLMHDSRVSAIQQHVVEPARKQRLGHKTRVGIGSFIGAVLGAAAVVSISLLTGGIAGLGIIVGVALTTGLIGAGTGGVTSDETKAGNADYVQLEEQQEEYEKLSQHPIHIQSQGQTIVGEMAAVTGGHPSGSSPSSSVDTGFNPHKLIDSFSNQ